MMGTNSVHPTMAIYASPMINTRVLLAAYSVYAFWTGSIEVRGEYHSTRLIENTAQHVFKIFKALLLILLPRLC